MDETALMNAMHEAMAPHMGAVYLSLFFAPFVQEEAAVIAAASLSLAGMGDGPLLFAVASGGLTASDLWKYWAGRLARTQGWARRLAQTPAVAKAEPLVRDRLGKTLLSVRFIPGARIPLYIAAGYFGASWPRYALWIAVSVVIYVAAYFALFHAVGMAAGEKAKVWLPVAAIALLASFLVFSALRKRMTRR